MAVSLPWPHDHCPLCTLFKPKDRVCSLAAARIQWWVLILSAYFTKYRVGIFQIQQIHVQTACLPSSTYMVPKSIEQSITAKDKTLS